MCEKHRREVRQPGIADMHTHPLCGIPWALNVSLLGTLYLDSTVGGQSLFSRCIRRIQNLISPQGKYQLDLILMQRLIKRPQDNLSYRDYENEVKNDKSN